MPLLVRLASVCQTDPFSQTWAWMGCSVLSAFGVDPNTLHGDAVYALMAHPASPGGAGCPYFLETLIGSNCLTEQLWQMMEPAGYLLVVAVLGARFARMLASNNYSAPPGWAVADPVLRAVVAMTFIHLSYGLLVFGHSETEYLGISLFQKITAAGGVTDAWVLLPSSSIPLVDIVHLLFSLYILLLVLASLVGFEVCIVLAPLVIPLWIFSGQNQVFSWFTRNVIGSTLLPIVVGVGWAVFLDMLRNFARQQSPRITITPVGGQLLPLPSWDNVLFLLGGWVPEMVFVCVGVWFMTKFIRATTGEVFASQNLLSTLFLTESVLLMTGRMAGRVLPQRTFDWFATRRPVQWLNSHRWLPHATARFMNAHNLARMSMVGQVANWIQVHGPARNAMAALMTPAELGEGAAVVYNNALAALESGNYNTGEGNAATIVEDFSADRQQRIAWEAYRRLPMARQIQLAAATFAKMDSVGLGRSSTRLQDRGRRQLSDTWGPGTHIGRNVGTIRQIIKEQTAPGSGPNLQTPIPPRAS
jgi:hypothetical protein